MTVLRLLEAILTIPRQGRGVQFYADGESYEGQWHKNKRRGWGRMFYKDGSLYEGEWMDDIREGRGLLRKGKILSSDLDRFAASE